MTIKSFILRSLCLPFVAAITLIAMLKHWLDMVGNFFLHGGEFVTYTKKCTKPMIGDVYNQLADFLKSQAHDKSN